MGVHCRLLLMLLLLLLLLLLLRMEEVMLMTVAAEERRRSLGAAVVGRRRRCQKVLDGEDGRVWRPSQAANAPFGLLMVRQHGALCGLKRRGTGHQTGGPLRSKLLLRKVFEMWFVGTVDGGEEHVVYGKARTRLIDRLAFSRSFKYQGLGAAHPMIRPRPATDQWRGPLAADWPLVLTARRPSYLLNWLLWSLSDCLQLNAPTWLKKNNNKMNGFVRVLWALAVGRHVSFMAHFRRTTLNQFQMNRLCSDRPLTGSETAGSNSSH